MKSSISAGVLLRGSVSLFLCAALLSVAHSENLDSYLSKLPKRLLCGVHAIDLSNGESVFSFQETKPLKPASVLKIATSYAALKLLGPEYRFQTEAFLSGSAPQTLTIRGQGDPNLTIENAWLLARALKRRGVREIGALKLDDSAFSSARGPVGDRAYETGASALSFNFNSILFDVCPGSGGKAASVTVDPWEAGASVSGAVATSGKSDEITIERTGDTPLSYRIGGHIPGGRSCIPIYRSVSDPLLYFGRTFLKLLDSIGIKNTGTFHRGEAPSGDNSIYTHSSKPLSDIVTDLNHFSNNFIAEQLLFALSSTRDSPATHGGGLEILTKAVQSLSIPDSEVHLEDASGLSHENRLSARTITRILYEISRNDEYSPQFEASLSVSEKSGTLKHRTFEDTLVRGKTGSLDGVSSLAGIIRTKRGRRVAFAAFENGIASKDEAISIEDKIVEHLSKL